MKFRTTFFICMSVLLTNWFAVADANSVLSVQSVSPISHNIDADRATAISIIFNNSIDPQSVNPGTFMVFGRWSGVMTGGVSFENNNTKLTFLPDKFFSAGETVTVTLSKMIIDTSGQPMAHGYAWSFWIKSNASSMIISEIERVPVRRSGEGRIQTYGANAADVNGDGFTDYMVPNEVANDVRVFLNDGNGGYSNFTVHPLTNAARPSTNDASDFNGDGFIDFAIGNTQNDRVHVLLGDGAGGFLSITDYHAASGVRGLALLDLDGDGKMDIVTANRGGNNLSLLHNNGDGTFATAINISGNGIGETACAAADANNDGILDLFVGALQSQEIILFLGDGSGSLVFADKIALAGSPWMIAAGDIDNDGNVDVVSANSNSKSASVVRGDGNGNLVSVETYPVGAVFPLAIDLGDLDGDGDLDMMTSSFGNNTPGDGQWTLYENDGSGVFTNPQYYTASTAASCAVFHDRDNDGDLDVTGIDEVDDLLFLFNDPAVGITAHEDGIATKFELRQNYPNPFNPQTVINYQLSISTEVTLTIFDMLGRKVRTLVNGQQIEGSHKVIWDGRNDAGKSAASGMYFYRISVRDQQVTKRMVLLR